jgi:hypothetical protein
MHSTFTWEDWIKVEGFAGGIYMVSYLQVKQNVYIDWLGKKIYEQYYTEITNVFTQLVPCVLFFAC